MTQPWPFDDPTNTIAITLSDVAKGASPILLVTHDADDGTWQFHDGRDNPNPDDGVVVCLEDMYHLDASMGELADLPLGWRAWRDAPDQPWQREVMEPEEDDEEPDPE